MSAIYAYAYLEAFAANADAFIYNGHLDGATGNPESGLFTSGADGAPDRKRAIYDTFADIDKKGAELPLGASAIYGERWNYLVSKYSKQITTAKIS